MKKSHAIRWYILIVFAFFFLVVFSFFGYAARKEPTVVIEDNNIEPISEPTITFIDPQKGTAAENAILTIVEFADYSCAACADTATNLSRILNKYPDRVRVVWKDFPNESHSDQATPAAIAARCAGQQGAYWQYHDELFLRQNLLSESAYFAIAEDLQLDSEEFAACYQSSDPLPRVKKGFQEGLALNITATPTLFIGDERIVGSIDYQELENMVRTLISE